MKLNTEYAKLVTQVRVEPEWAANRIIRMRSDLTAAEARIEKLERAYGVLKEEIGQHSCWACRDAFERAEGILRVTPDVSPQK